MKRGLDEAALEFRDGPVIADDARGIGTRSDDAR